MFAGILWIGAFTYWIAHLTRWNIYPFAWTDCKLGYFLYYFAADFSSMLLPVMSVEKLFALYFPLKAKSYCTVGTAKWVTFILALVIGGLNVPVFLWYKSIGNHCLVMKHLNYFVMLNTLLYSLVPIFSMFLSTAAIICKLMQIKYKGMSMQGLSVPFACVGSGDPVRVLSLYTTNTLDIF